MTSVSPPIDPSALKVGSEENGLSRDHAPSTEKERPILFSGAMVRALLAGTKTQTRRVAKPQDPSGVAWDQLATDGECWWLDSDHELGKPYHCPYGVPGDVLWVKETFRLPAEYDHLKPTMIRDGVPVWYEADGRAAEGWGKVRVSLHMQRRFSRLSLRITDVRVERLNDCSEADAKAEGVEYCDEPAHDDCFYRGTVGYRCAYERLWEQINGAGSWAKNPFVWAVSFELVQS